MSRVAILVGDGYEDSEFQLPFECLRNAGHEVVVLGSRRDSIVRGKRGETGVRIEHSADEVEPSSFDAIVVPGGHSPDRLRIDPAIVEFTRRFADTGGLVAAICHGPQLLIEARLVSGRTITSWPSVRTDLVNAGADWVDEAVVEDDNLVTSRKPDDLDVFCAAILRRL
jgi:protease I